MGAKVKPNELSLIRIYDADIKDVWDAWTDPKKVAKWWGPRGFTLTTHSKELKVGGIWHYTMHGPDGVDYPNKTLYHEVEKYSRLVYDHGGYDERKPLFKVTVDFTEMKGHKTKMEMVMALATPEAASEIKKFIKLAGGDSTWDRLAEYVEKEKSGKEHFVINRSFDASIDVMFDMWTDPKHFSQWLPPTGFTMKFIRAEIKEGGSSFYSMTDGKDITMYGSVRYLEIKRPNFIKYVQDFRDEHEKISRHPFAPTWPEYMTTTIFLNEEEDGQTRVTVVWEAADNANSEELAAFVKEKAGMTMGWTGSFDKLEDYLKSR
jgi:uncharacterized protein YndB with AHSA1/START domain